MSLEQLVEEIKTNFIGTNNWLLVEKSQRNIPQNPNVLAIPEYKEVISIVTDDFEIIRITTTNSSKAKQLNTHIHVESFKTIFRGDSSDLSIRSSTGYRSLYYGNISCKDNTDEIDINFLLSVLERRTAIGKQNTHN